VRPDLEAAVDKVVDDLVPPRLRLLFVGINPGLWTAAVNAHFARPGNRFWPAMHRAGLTSRLVDASQGMQAEDLEDLCSRGIGITNLAPRATRRADEVTAEELREGRDRLVRLVSERRPRVVAVAGVTAYRIAFGDRDARTGRQPRDLAGAELWVVPNPSGLNAHATIESLAAAYAEVGRAAGVRA
jgi:TDG/mug DNA glycosylase family protein